MKQRYLSKCHRGQLPRSGKPWQGRASVTADVHRDLHDHDPVAELISWGEEVHLYRVIVAGATPSDDIIAHQMVIPKQLIPITSSFVDYLKECDSVSKYGRRRSILEKQRLLRDPADEADHNFKMRMNEISEAVAPDLINFVDRHRMSIITPSRTSKVLEVHSASA